MSVVHISEHEFVTTAGILRVPPLRSYAIELQEDKASELITCGPQAQALRVYAEEDCTLLFGDREMRLAAGAVELFALAQGGNVKIAVKASE